MSKWTALGACFAASACTFVWCRPSSAAGKARFHLGLETSLVNSTSTDVTRPASTNDATTTSTTKFVSRSTQYGLPGKQALSLGVSIGDIVDVGARLGYSNTTSKLGDDATAAEVSLDEYVLSPYVAYLSGSRESLVRVTAGGLLGIGAGNSTYSIPTGDASTPATTRKSSLTTTQYGVLLGLRLRASDLLSIDPIATVTSTSAKLTGSGTLQEAEMSGMTFTLNVGFSLWFGGGPRETPPPKAPTQAWKPPQTPTQPAVPGVPAQTPVQPAVPGVPAQTPVPPTTPTAPVAPTQTPAPPPAPNPAPTAAAVVAPQKPTRLTIALGEGRSALLMVKQTGQAQSISVVLRESRADSNLTTCKHIVLNAPYQPELPIPAVLARGITANGSVPILKAEATAEQLSALAASPAMDVDGVSDHWIDVCGRPWHMAEAERVRLKGYLDTL